MGLSRTKLTAYMGGASRPSRFSYKRKDFIMSVGVIAGNVASINYVQATVDLGSVAANTSEEETFTLTGVKVGDLIIVQKEDLEAGIVLGSARVETADTVTVEVINTTASAVDAASATMNVLVIRPEGDATNLPTGLQI